MNNKIIKNIFTFFDIVFLLILIFSFSISFLESLDYLPNFIVYSIQAVYLMKKILIFVCFFGYIAFKKINKIDIAFLIICLIVILFTLLNESSINLFFDSFFDIASCAVCFLIFSNLSIGFDKIRIILTLASMLFGTICLLMLLNHPDLTYFIGFGYMNFSNSLLIPTAILLYSFYIKKNPISLIFALVYMFFIFIYGSRGALLSVGLIALVFLLFMLRKKPLSELLFMIVVLAVIIVLSNSDLSIFKGRNLSAIISGNLLYSSDRIEIWSILLKDSSNNMFFVKGLCADRAYLNSYYGIQGKMYAHNIAIELLCDFGILGIFLFVWLCTEFVLFFWRCKAKEKRALAFVFFSVSFIQLLFSRSFIVEPCFFILLSIVVNNNHDSNLQRSKVSSNLLTYGARFNYYSNIQK